VTREHETRDNVCIVSRKQQRPQAARTRTPDEPIR
jgi:hypothetical protein